MKYNPEIHHRRSIRLKGYDYSRKGSYFVTICIQNRQCLFGQIVDGVILLNDAGRMVERWYSELENKFPDIQCDEFICMPNHVHFIAVNVGADLRVRPDTDLRVRPDTDLRVRPNSVARQTIGEHIGSPLHRVVQWFKTMSTNEYIRSVKQHGWRPFPGKLWQRNYWEHIIRDEPESNRIREYILNNPVRWDSDQLFVGADLCVRPDGSQGQTRRSAPRGIHESCAMYGYGTSCPDDEVWMV